MNSPVFWKLMLFLCATSFRETSEKVVPGESPRCTGLQPPRQALPGSWEQSPRCKDGKPARAGPSPRGASPQCPPPESPTAPQHPGVCSAAGSHRTPAPRGAVLVPREKDLSYNWNSFGLRYGKRQAQARLPEPPRAHRAAGARP